MTTEERQNDPENAVERMDTRFDRLETLLETRFNAVDARLDGVDTRFDAVDARLTGIDTRNAIIESRLESINMEFDRMNSRLNTLVSGTLTLLATIIV